MKGKKKRWRAKLNGSYYIIDHDGTVVEMREDWYIADNEGYAFGNYFKTRKDAKKARSKIRKLLSEL